MSSDLAELTGGLPRVWVAVPDAPDSTVNESNLNGSDKVRLRSDTTARSERLQTTLHSFLKPRDFF